MGDPRMRRYGYRPFAYRWNHDAQFPGRGRFSRTRGNDKRARTEASCDSATGEPFLSAATGGRLRRRPWRGASPVSDPRVPPAVAATETRRGRERLLRQRLRHRPSLKASERRVEGGGRAGAGPDVTCVGGGGVGPRVGAGRAGRAGRPGEGPATSGYCLGVCGLGNAALLPPQIWAPELGCDKPGAGLSLQDWKERKLGRGRRGNKGQMRKTKVAPRLCGGRGPCPAAEGQKNLGALIQVRGMETLTENPRLQRSSDSHPPSNGDLIGDPAWLPNSSSPKDVT